MFRQLIGMPLSVRVLVAVVLGTTLGAWRGTAPYFPGFGSAELGQLGLLVIRILKALAVPLILFAIVDAFIQAPIRARSGARLVAICLVNVSVAFAIGLSLINGLEPGKPLQGRLESMTAQVAGTSTTGKPPAEATLNPLQNLSGYIPQSLLEPLLGNNVISVVLIALVFGAALGQMHRHQAETGIDVRPLTGFVSASFALLIKVLGWIVEIVPLGVFALVTHVVAKAGLGVFLDLGLFLMVVCLGLLLHSLIYYPLAAWLVAGKSPKTYLQGGADAVLTGLSANSSLAAVPITLRCLSKLGVGEGSARLAVCAGTNLNNDGVTLYEAMTALFLAQALGYELGAGQQLVVVLSALMAGAGIAGIPEAGLIVLPLVLSAAGLPEGVVAGAIPLIASVDWIIARLRSGVNVLSDLLVAIVLDAWERRDDPT